MTFYDAEDLLPVPSGWSRRPAVNLLETLINLCLKGFILLFLCATYCNSELKDFLRCIVFIL